MTSERKVTYRRGMVTQHLLCLMYMLLLLDWVVVLASAVKIRRLCKNGIDILSDEGVRIEPLERSHVELLLSKHRIRKRDIIRFQFRTESENGILFYGRNRSSLTDLQALRILGGQVYYRIVCPTASADVLIPLRRKINDGRWHRVVVKFHRGGRKTKVIVDGKKNSKIYEASCSLPAVLVFGGVSHNDSAVVNKILGDVPHFQGCIRKVDVPTALRSPPQYYAISNCQHSLV
ncbi:hypothetical protein ACOMHN_041203 [Nucella lapillus]